MANVTVTKGKAGVEDIQFGTGTYTRTDKDGVDTTLEEVCASNVPIEDATNDLVSPDSANVDEALRAVQESLDVEEALNETHRGDAAPHSGHTTDSEFNSLLRGHIKGLFVKYKDADEIYIDGGSIHIYDGSTNHILYCNSQLTKQLTGISADTFEYIYVDPPDSGSTIATADIEYDTTAPTYDHTKKGWYHPTNTDWRFIGSVAIGTGDVVRAFQRSENGHLYLFDDDVGVLTSGSATTWTDVTNLPTYGCPAIEDALAIVEGDLTGTAAGSALLRKNGTAGGGTHFIYIVANGGASNTDRIAVDSSGLIEYKVGDAAQDLNLYSVGYWEPR